jgi:hypothetical protein
MKPCGDLLDKDMERVLDVLDQGGGTSSTPAMLNFVIEVTMLSKPAMMMMMMMMMMVMVVMMSKS